MGTIRDIQTTARTLERSSREVSRSVAAAREWAPVAVTIAIAIAVTAVSALIVAACALRMVAHHAE